MIQAFDIQNFSGFEVQGYMKLCIRTFLEKYQIRGSRTALQVFAGNPRAGAHRDLPLHSRVPINRLFLKYLHLALGRGDGI